MNLSNILVIVTRYFGGTLLGTGGLVKAYTDATKKALEESKLKNQTKGYELKIVTEYSEIEKTKYFLNKNGIAIKKIEYMENIEIIIEIPTEDLEKITNIYSDNTLKIIKHEILKEKFIDI